jgi:cyclohexanecarboxylate-CoA ligase
METTSELARRGQQMRATGFWTDCLLDRVLDQHLAERPDKTALVAYRCDRTEPVRLSYRALMDRVARAAAALLRMGIGHGDVVSIQLPNWWEFVVTVLACGRIGAVVNPLMHIFRERELEYMLGFAGSRVLVVPRQYRGFDFERMAKGLRSALPGLQHIVVIDGEGPDGFDACMLSGDGTADIAATPGAVPLGPDDLAVLMFTSGTTGSPKGVMHSTNTLTACMNALSGRFGIGEADVYQASTPMGHMTGYVAVVLIGLRNGGTVVLQDFWDPAQGVAIARREHTTYFAGSTPFLNDILGVVAASGEALPDLRTFLCGGAPIPPVLIERARAEIGLVVCSLWGMTEVLSGTLTEPQRAAEKSASTDGRALEGMEVRVVDDTGRDLPTGAPGRLWVRGAQLFLGYYRRPDIRALDDDGWFDSGDLAYSDAEGYIRICGRTKDVLIRGGENVPVVEIEGVMLELPQVRAAAIVGYPDDRLGERACAFVTLQPGQRLSLEDVQAHMRARKVAKQYWPERLVVLDALPATPSGKVQKFKLRELAAADPERARDSHL